MQLARMLLLNQRLPHPRQMCPERTLIFVAAQWSARRNSRRGTSFGWRSRHSSPTNLAEVQMPVAGTPNQRS